MLHEFARAVNANDTSIPLLLIEEPEAHMHPQLQTAFVSFLDKFLEEGLGVPVFVAENALDCVAEGCGVMLENTQYLQ